MTRRHVTVKVGTLKRTVNHIREDLGTEEELRQLGRSYLKRAVNPIICRQVGEALEIADGIRRSEAALLVGGPDAEVPVCITDEPLDESAMLEIMMESAIHTRGLSAYEEYLGASQWMERNPGATAERLGERIGRKPAMMSRILSLGRCVPAVKEAAASGLLGVTEWNEFSKCSEQQQLELLAARLSGQVSSRDQLARAVRKSRSGSPPVVRQSRIKIVMPQATVIIIGTNLGMSELGEVLTDARNEVSKAAPQYNVKTFQSMMRDKAAKRGAR